MPIDPGTATIIAGSAAAAGSAGSSAISAGRGRRGQRRQQKYTRENQASARAYQTQMDNTKFQRSMADMKAAGLNPALMYSGSASVGSAPQGAGPQGAGAPSVDIADPSQAVAATVATAKQAQQTKANIDNINKNTSLLNAKQTTEYLNQINALFSRNSIAAKITGDLKKSFHTQKQIKSIMDGIFKNIQKTQKQ